MVRTQTRSGFALRRRVRTIQSASREAAASYDSGRRSGYAPWGTTVPAASPYRALMRTVPRASMWLSALAVAALQVVGTFGASDSQPERRALDALAVVLLLVGPAALAVRDRWPVAAIVASTGSAVVFIGLGY